MIDQARGDTVVGFCSEVLRHVSGRSAGSRFVLRPWQEKIFRDLFSTVGDDGLRQYREALIAVPRKNGKSTMGAAMALASLCLDKEEGGQIFSAAADRDQARLVFAIAKSMVARSEVLTEILTVYNDAIINEEYSSVYRPLSSDAFTKHGLSPSCVVFDELHCMRTPELYETLLTGMGARSQPLMVSITTAGYARESICRKVWDYAASVREGMITDPAFYSAIWETDPKADWTNPEQWQAANPNLGVSVSMEFLSREAAKAATDTAYENTFRRLFLNQWTEQATRFIPMSDWDDAPDEMPDIDGVPCYMGLDLSNTIDLTAWVLAFPVDDGIVLLPHAYIPADRMDVRERRDRVPYRAWVQDGLITATPGNSVDYDRVLRDITEACQIYDVRGIAVDRWNSTQITQQLMHDGANIVQHGQGYRDMSDPTKQLQRLVVDKKIWHGNHPVLRWNMSNLVVQTDEANNYKPDKKRSAEKVDLAVAAIMAISVYNAEQVAGANHYDTHDLKEYTF